MPNGQERKGGLRGEEGGVFPPNQVQIQKEAIEAVARGRGREKSRRAIEAMVRAELYSSQIPKTVIRLK